MGLDIYLYDGDLELNEKSDWFPNHFLSKTYLRSSYNDGGFNTVSERLYGITLYEVFDAEENGYLDENNMDEKGRVPMKNLDVALEKAKDLAKKFDNEEHPLFVMTITSKDGLEVSDKFAIKIVKKALKDKEKDRAHFDWYSNGAGTFFVGDEPLNNVRGIIHGSLWNKPAVHIVYEPDYEIFNSYRQAAHIVVEFIEFAMTLKEPKIIWSN